MAPPDPRRNIGEEAIIRRREVVGMLSGGWRGSKPLGTELPETILALGWHRYGEFADVHDDGHSTFRFSGARRAPRVEALFAHAVIACESRGPVCADLFPEESQALGNAVAKRRQEFVGGRACARGAMARLGFAPVPLPPRSDRRPAWPMGLTGSITHTADYCCAVVCRADDGAIGIDAQITADVTEELWKTIFTEEELGIIAKLMPEQRGLAAALGFSAKESFFKAQFEITQMWVDFNAVAVTASEGKLEIHILDPALAKQLCGRTVAGRYLVDADMVITGIDL